MINDLTFCVKTFLRDDYLERCIRSIREYYPLNPVIVFDDGNYVETKAATLRDHDVQYVHVSPMDQGVSYGRNVMVDMARTNYVLIMEDDMTLTPESRIEDMLTLTEIADVVCGAPRLKGDHIHHYEGILGTEPYDHLSITRIPSEYTRDYRGISFQAVDLGMNILCGRRTTFQRNVWDERFKVVYEHLDWFVSAQQKGLEVVYAPDCIFDHKYPVIPKTEIYRKFRERTDESRPKFYDKWGFKFVDDMEGYRNYPDGSRHPVEA